MSLVLKTRPGWRLATLQHLVFFQRGYDITKAEQKHGDIPVVSSSGINSFHSEAKVDGPGVIIGRKGSLGTVHYVEGPYWPHDTTLWSKDLNGNHARFVYYFMHTLGLDRYDVGNSNPTLNRNHIHGLDIEIPEHQLQERSAWPRKNRARWTWRRCSSWCRNWKRRKAGRSGKDSMRNRCPCLTF